jgi:hypothetical protein
MKKYYDGQAIEGTGGQSIPDKVKQEPDGEWREKYYDLQERYEEKKEAASMWAKKCMEKHQDYLALLELQEKTEKKVKAENYQTILGLKQQLQSLTAEVKRLEQIIQSVFDKTLSESEDLGQLVYDIQCLCTIK